MTILKVRQIKKVKKQHNCQWCGEKINEAAYYYVWIEDGDFCRCYNHPECHKASLELNQDDRDSIWPGEFKRGTTELK